MSVRVGVDIGGTFTDFCVYEEETQNLQTLKVPSTPETPGDEVLAGMRFLQEARGIAPENIVRFVHGTTVGINTVIQRKGMALALFVTEGFADVLELARRYAVHPVHGSSHSRSRARGTKDCYRARSALEWVVAAHYGKRRTLPILDG